MTEQAGRWAYTWQLIKDHHKMTNFKGGNEQSHIGDTLQKLDKINIIILPEMACWFLAQ